MIRNRGRKMNQDENETENEHVNEIKYNRKTIMAMGGENRGHQEEIWNGIREKRCTRKV